VAIRREQGFAILRQGSGSKVLGEGKEVSGRTKKVGGNQKREGKKTKQESFVCRSRNGHLKGHVKRAGKGRRQRLDSGTRQGKVLCKRLAVNFNARGMVCHRNITRKNEVGGKEQRRNVA